LWNANGTRQHTEELKTFISIHNIGDTLISDKHFIEESYLELPIYTAYHTNHSAGTVPGGTAVIIKNPSSITKQL
jgi:hypothetical protein